MCKNTKILARSLTLHCEMCYLTLNSNIIITIYNTLSSKHEGGTFPPCQCSSYLSSRGSRIDSANTKRDTKVSKYFYVCSEA